MSQVTGTHSVNLTETRNSHSNLTDFECSDKASAVHSHKGRGGRYWVTPLKVCKVRFQEGILKDHQQEKPSLLSLLFIRQQELVCTVRNLEHGVR